MMKNNDTTKPWYRVVDNFLEPEEFKYLNDIMQSSNFPWYWNDSIDFESDDPTMLDNYQFTHTFFHNNHPNSEYYGMMGGILNKLQALSVIRIKANLQPRTNTIIKNQFHTDFNVNERMANAVTAVLYMNTNNGKTIFEDGSEIESVENRIVLFNPIIKHTGTSCTDSKRRVVINFNYIQHT